ncbi:hypothetical protein ACFRI7_11860 [Streptomyces sp. NPDC056716]|uniref:hypothetical protein n=1 Tax=unclassified Streptomyces TaxID=2593676 RepID=UPI0036AD7962
MRNTDLNAETILLHGLADALENVHSDVRSLDLTPGSELRRQITRQIIAVNALAAQAMDRLAALDGSQYTTLPGSRTTVKALTSTVHSTTIAAAELAGVLAANPLPGTAFNGTPYNNTVRALLHQNAAPLIEEHHSQALEQLDLASTGCHYLATIIARDLTTHTGPNIPTQAAPALTPPARRRTGHTR